MSTQVQIEKLSHEGRGVARVNGKTTFISGALPEEIVTFQYSKKKKDYDEGKLLEIIKPSPQRQAPTCQHFQQCGGCSLQHLDSKAQILIKQEWLLDLLQRIAKQLPEKILTPLSDDYWHYRNKARLSVRYVEKKQATLVGFREKINPRYICEITTCAILPKRVDAAIPAIRSLIDNFSNPRIIAQIEIAAGDEDIALIFRNLESLTLNDEELLKKFAAEYNFLIYLQPQGPDSVFFVEIPRCTRDDGLRHDPKRKQGEGSPAPRASFPLSYTLPEENLTFHFHPTDFTQINAAINRLMIKQALNLLELNKNDVVLDLFCGLGNFSLPMAKYCSKVIGIEGNREMVARAQMNAKLNIIENTEFYMQNLDNPLALEPFKKYKFSKILLDPPRTGALELIKNMADFPAEKILYISCNPVTLARDSELLIQQGYKLKAAGVMDMFPHTSHVESMALFERQIDG